MEGCLRSPKGPLKQLAPVGPTHRMVGGRGVRAQAKPPSAIYTPWIRPRTSSAFSHWIPLTALQGRCHCPLVTTNQETRRSRHLYWSARAAVREHHKLRGSNNRNILPPCSGGWKPEINMLAGLGISEASLVGEWMASSPCVSPHLPPTHARLCVQTSLD